MTKSTSKIELSTVKRKYNDMGGCSHFEKRRAEKEKKMADKIPAKGCVSEQESAGKVRPVASGANKQKQYYSNGSNWFLRRPIAAQENTRKCAKALSNWGQLVAKMAL